MINDQELNINLDKSIKTNAALEQHKKDTDHALMPDFMDMSVLKDHKENEDEMVQHAKIVDLSQIDAKLKTYRTDRSKTQIRQNNADWETLKKENEEGTKRSQIADSELVKNNSELLLRDKKWTRFFFASESPEMIAVKQSVAYLNNLLDGEVKTTKINNKEDVDVKDLLDRIIPAYQTAYDACDKYVSVRSAEGKKKGYGLRRLNKVKAMLTSLRKEMNEMKLVVDNIQNSQKVGFTEEEDYLGKKKTDKKRMSIRHLVGEIVRRKAVVCAYVPEGNSSHTYRVKVKDDKTGKYYYVKKEEPLLNENLPGYLDNRLAELNRSKQIKDNNKKAGKGPDHVKKLDQKIADLNKKVEEKKMDEEAADKEIIQIRAQREELRLENILDEKDYDYGIRLFTAMKDKIDAARGDAKNDQIQRYIKFFAHDFDDFFRRLSETNALVAKLKKDGDQIDELISTLRSKDAKKYERQIKDLERIKGSGYEQMSELDWIELHKDDLGLGDGQGNELMEILREMGIDKTDTRRISKFFQRTTGKEAELFGQQSSRSGTSGSDVLAANNTATSRLARKYGFDDVVTHSFKGKLDMTEVGQTKTVVNNVTFSEEAQGEELLQIVQDAQKHQKEKGIKEPIVHFSPEAIRDLSRMHTFDLSTAQTDRHWRNIKSKVTKKMTKDNKPMWIIGKSMCYDHDQSLGIKDLKTYFKDLKDDKTGEVKTVGEGFLKPIMMTVSKKSSLYRYAVQNKMTDPTKIAKTSQGYNEFLDGIPMPKSKTKSLDEATKYYKSRNKQKDQYTVEPDSMTQRILTGHFKWDETISLNMAFDEKEQEIAKDQETVLKAAAKRNEGKEAQCQQFFEILYKLCNATSVHKQNKPGYYDVVDSFLFDSKDKLKAAQDKYNNLPTKEGRSQREKCMLRKDFIKDFRKLVDLYNMLDFTHLEEDTGFSAPAMFTGSARCVGYYDYTFQSIFHLFKLKLQENPDSTQKAIKELAKDETLEIEKQVEAEAKKKGITLSKKDKEERVKKKIQEEQAETARVPAILHMDKEAYDSIKEAYENPEVLDTLLIDLELTKDKKDALKRRLKNILDDADEAARIVNEWADKKGLPPEAIERKFFLEKDDYKKIKSLTDMALDPGQSYFSVEDSQFMVGNSDMQKFLGTKDKDLAREITNEERTTRRQKVDPLKADDTYTSYVSNSIAS